MSSFLSLEDQQKNLLLVINNILEYINTRCHSINDNMIYKIPCNFDDNFPVSLNFKYNKESLYLNNKN